MSKRKAKAQLCCHSLCGYVSDGGVIGLNVKSRIVPLWCLIPEQIHVRIRMERRSNNTDLD